ncbi:MAG TPA: DUF1801 domain-containing protein [Chitinophagales bacterium]|nr:DUF1801 domain-containing protein [Chitinophagales bacterium]HRG28605.1 DUF1801 domain-containing protein [Chitinophagales bacterium]HRG86565.1 DUF1801 domain-containing protein [Chitinophagales bacterium]HRH52804.1 DUF1801 domain-containing protein [Chitinophagales bacterium]
MPAKKSKLATIKTQETTASVEQFLNTIEDEQKRKDSYVIVEMMKKATKAEPKMWGSAIIGFGNTRYVSPKTGREVDWLIIGFSPRKANLSLYVKIHANNNPDLIKKLGKCKTGAGCLYINKLSDIDAGILQEIINASVKTK